MGALHNGHLSLVKASKKRDHLIIVSIFVNQSQFGKYEDYNSYPIENNSDLKKLKKHKVDIVFMPNKNEILDFDISNHIYKPKRTEKILCGKSRPNYFSGVAQIIIKLFSIIDPDISYFGEKDFQQYVFIKNLIKDQKFKSKIKSVKTVREKSGLAMSSRNIYLSINEKKIACNLYKILKKTKKEILTNNSSSNAINKYKKILIKLGFTKIDYFEMRTDELKLAKSKDLNKRLFIAAFIGKTRLIDNLKI
tara:strand:- start:162 stop:911 length:750 start_codon:yes stop_codon:yes gene_type:complete